MKSGSETVKSERLAMHALAFRVSGDGTSHKCLEYEPAVRIAGALFIDGSTPGLQACHNGSLPQRPFHFELL